VRIRSKRHGRIREPQDPEFDSPYFEIIVDGKRVIGLENGKDHEGLPLPRFPLSLLHSKLSRSEILLKYYSKLLNNPERYEGVPIEKAVTKLELKNLIIGCGTSGLSLLEELGHDSTLAICYRELGFIEFDDSNDPLISKIELIKNLKKIYKLNSEKIVKGIFLGRFDEGLVFDIFDKILLINAERVFLASGSRYILPLFNDNDNPKVISKNLFLLNKKKYKKIIVLGSSNDALKAALNAENAVILYREGARYFSKFYLEEVERKGYEIVGIRRLKFIDNGKDVLVITDKGEWQGDVIVYAIVRQPKLEISSNIGIPYDFFTPLHIYLPSHDITGKSIGNAFIVGGMRGISFESLSYLSSKYVLGRGDEFKDYLRSYEEYLYPYYEGKWAEVSISPYMFDEEGYVCLCEDITYSDMKSTIKEGFNTVEEVKRVCGLATGSCQGKICTFLAGSIMNSKVLITFRSPLYRLVI